VRFFVQLLYGFIAAVLACFPIWIAIIVYSISRHYGSSKPLVFAELAGCFSLLLIPIYMLGRSLEVSTNGPKPAPAPVPVTVPSTPAAQITTDILEMWKTAVTVQQHFNDLEIQIRNFAVTLLVTVIGAAAFALKEHYVIKLAGTDSPLAAGILFVGIIGWLAFYFMDRFWYHRLLIAAVSHAVDIETRFADTSPELGLTNAIGKGSAWKIWGFSIRSSERIDLFYALGLTVLIVLIVFLIVTT
jgi:hypothetical protein